MSKIAQNTPRYLIKGQSWNKMKKYFMQQNKPERNKIKYQEAGKQGNNLSLS